MIKYEKNEAGKEILEVTGEVFIIPNSLGTIGGFKECSWLKTDVSQMYGTAKHAGLNVSDTDKTVQLWMCCDESENICRHGIPVTVHDQRIHISIHGFENLPCKLFNGKKEGDQVELFYSFKGTWGDDVEEDIEITFKLTLAQSKYRYRNYGTFEECLRQLGYEEV